MQPTNFSEYFRKEREEVQKETRRSRQEYNRDAGSRTYWQATAKGLITRWDIPSEQQTSVYRFCKLLPRHIAQRAIDDTEELASGLKWKYFFAICNRYIGYSRAAAPARSSPPDKIAVDET